MKYRLLLDENIEHQVLHTLRNYGHDVVHVDERRKGQSDAEVGAVSLEENRLVLTYDDDFKFRLTADEYAGVLYVENDEVSASTVATAVHEMSTLYPQAEIQEVEYLDAWF